MITDQTRWVRWAEELKALEFLLSRGFKKVQCAGCKGRGRPMQSTTLICQSCDGFGFYLDTPIPGWGHRMTKPKPRRRPVIRFGTSKGRKND